MDSLVFLLLIFGLGYFMIVRPQQKRQKERTDLLSSLDVGDDVVTIGGLHGRIEALSDTTADLAIAEDETGDPVLLRFDRQAISRVVVPSAAGAGERDLDELLHDEPTDDLSDDAADAVDAGDAGQADTSADRD